MSIDSLVNGSNFLYSGRKAGLYWDVEEIILVLSEYFGPLFRKIHPIIFTFQQIYLTLIIIYASIIDRHACTVCQRSPVYFNLVNMLYKLDKTI